MKAKEIILDRSYFGEFVVVAEEQFSGNGRGKNKWISPKGNLYMSIALPVQDKYLNNIRQLFFVSAISVGGVISDIVPRCNYFYKWPNDIFVGQKKLSGILLQVMKQDAVNYLIIGIGLNVLKSPLENTTCLAKYGLFVNNSILSIAKQIVKNFDRLFYLWMVYGFAPIKNQWIEREVKNFEMQVSGLNSIGGVYAGIDDCGNLLIYNNGVKTIDINGICVYN